MKALILGAILALTPVSAMAVPPADNAPITQEEIEERADICVNVATGHYTAQQVITAMQLDTDRKKRDFVIQCKLLFLGLDVGKELAGQVGAVN